MSGIVSPIVPTIFMAVSLDSRTLDSLSPNFILICYGDYLPVIEIFGPEKQDPS